MSRASASLRLSQRARLYAAAACGNTSSLKRRLRGSSNLGMRAAHSTDRSGGYFIPLPPRIGPGNKSRLPRVSMGRSGKTLRRNAMSDGPADKLSRRNALKCLAYGGAGTLFTLAGGVLIPTDLALGAD